MGFLYSLFLFAPWNLNIFLGILILIFIILPCSWDAGIRKELRREVIDFVFRYIREVFFVVGIFMLFFFYYYLGSITQQNIKKNYAIILYLHSKQHISSFNRLFYCSLRHKTPTITTSLLTWGRAFEKIRKILFLISFNFLCSFSQINILNLAFLLDDCG